MLMTFMFKHQQNLDEFEDETKARAAAGKCEGSCDSHEGLIEVFRVVSDEGTDWGWFSYCETAQEEDKQRGFLLYKNTPS